MEYKRIDMDSYARRCHFEYFNAMANPYVGMTAEVDITSIYTVLKRAHRPFFLSMCYCAVRAANAVSAFRMRVKDGCIVEYPWCDSSHTEYLDDGTYCYCTLDCRLALNEFYPAAIKAQSAARNDANFTDEGDADSLIFVSCVPWTSYTSIVQPTPSPADYNPRITWGRYFERDGRLLMPVTVLCNHALVDGKHISDFYTALDRQIEEVCALL